MKKLLFLFVLMILSCEDDEIDPFVRNFEWASKAESIEFLEDNFPSIVIDPQTVLESNSEIMFVEEILTLIKSSNTFSDITAGLSPVDGGNFKIGVVNNLAEFRQIDLLTGVYLYNESTQDFDLVSDASNLIIQVMNEENELIEVEIHNNKSEDWNTLSQRIYLTTNFGINIDNDIYWNKKGETLELANFRFMIHTDSFSVEINVEDDILERDMHMYSYIRREYDAQDEFGNVHSTTPYEQDIYTLNQTSHGTLANGSVLDNNLVHSFFDYDRDTDLLEIQLVRYNRDTREELRIGNVLKIDGKYVVQFEDETTAEYSFLSDLVDQVKFIH